MGTHIAVREVKNSQNVVAREKENWELTLLHYCKGQEKLDEILQQKTKEILLHTLQQESQALCFMTDPRCNFYLTQWSKSNVM